LINDLQINQGGNKEERCVGGNTYGDVTPCHWVMGPCVSRQRGGLVFQGPECSKEFVDARIRDYYVDPKRSEPCVMSGFRRCVN
jgi:hypothetical protein